MLSAEDRKAKQSNSEKERENPCRRMSLPRWCTVVSACTSWRRIGCHLSCCSAARNSLARAWRMQVGWMRRWLNKRHPPGAKLRSQALPLPPTIGVLHILQTVVQAAGAALPKLPLMRL